jgi:hypothetical protein
MPPDVLVVGGGVAGLSAALVAADRGARVEVLERGPAVGGAALLSNGSLWTFDDVGTYLERCPGADPALARLVATGLDLVVSWLRGQGAEVTERGPSLYGAARSYQIVPRRLAATLHDAVRARATLTTDDPATSLRLDGGGTGVTTATGRRIEAAAVVVATGGIHADEPMLRAAGLGHYVGLPVRNRPEDGDGVRIASRLGAELAGTYDGIYGHLVPAGIAPDAALSPLAAQYQSHAGVLLGLDGTLLARAGTDDHHLNRMLTRRPGRRGVLVYDAQAAPPLIRAAVGGSGWAADRFAFARAHGSRVTRAGTLGELAGSLTGWGLDTLAPDAREALADALGRPPFHAVEVEPSITHSGAGLRVTGTLEIPGLPGVFAAGQDIGGAFGEGYAGGLAFAIRTGMAAGRGAAATARRVAGGHVDHDIAR